MLPLAVLPWRLIAVGAAAAGLLAWGALGHRAAGVARTELAEARTQHAQREAAWTAAALAQTELNRNIERARSLSIEEAAHVARQRTEVARRDTADAADAAEQLFQRSIAAAAASCSAVAGNPTAAQGGPATSAPELVHADVLRRLEAAGRVAVAALDASWIAGSTCERAYDALTR